MKTTYQNLTNRTKEIIISWDTFIAAVIATFSYIYLPNIIPLNIIKELYFTALSVLSISFPMFFAALAIIISKSDDNFVDFLDEDSHYSVLLFQFKFSLYVLFITLILTLLIYGFILLNINNHYFGQEKYQFVIYIFLFFYSL